ncbi:type II toxin-antitoxin system prevent-host-death family antitoxin [Rhizobium sp. CNPSo 3464]|uniref:type II toxin-antitoxin system Phd/YefM family antitoxin n=1 Tax=Rhizobium sp. CNPSo 3464 TaxID=3021406 RepID=UPI00254D4A19|nr:type II toxin-antitoxin system prevent-host-death family antitoxin [Rhizobium sp. CNPSo 3464]MDK4738515.1 type II toxin-antitoxin system prevent-host-death family antitoxin [Rhizobium sp. CNPSo 3464]
MSIKSVGAAEFKAKCLHLIDQMSDDGEAIVITKRGKPVALLSPVPEKSDRKSIIGAMKGSVLRYDDPFSPVVDAEEWDAMR